MFFLAFACFGGAKIKKKVDHSLKEGIIVGLYCYGASKRT